ncbi:MAG: cell division protein FtsQ/DivIB [Myxococcota bacterium]
MGKSKPRNSHHVIEEDEDDLPPPPSAFARLGKKVLKAVFRPKRLLLLALIPILGTAAPVVWRHRPQIKENPIYRFTAAEIHISETPSHVPTDLVARTVEAAELGPEFSVLDRDLLPRLADAFSKEPWVKRVVQLRKGLPAHVEADLEYRTPVAMIDVKSGVYPIDAEGVLLPPEDFTPAEVKRYPLVTGVRSLPAGPPGTPWGDNTVLGAAKVAATVAPHWTEFDLTAIHAPTPIVAQPTLDELTFELHTRGGSRVVWGRPPGTGHPGELTADQKLGRLKRYVTDFGPFAAPGPPFEIDIRPWQEITRRPLATAERGHPGWR